MAKLKAPLFSFGASGKLADSLVFMTWKGLNTVRQYVIPANPKSDDQIAQRGYMKVMVPAVHTAQARATFPLGTTDYSAYSALAAKLGIIMTWFNMICKLGFDCLRLSDGYTIYSGGHTPDPRHDHFRPWLSITDNGVLQVAAGKFFLGTSRTNLLKSKAAVVDAGVSVGFTPPDGFDDLVAGTKYYWQFRPDAADPCEGADSGIYSEVAT